MKNLINISQELFGVEKTDSVDSRDLYKKLGLAKGQYSRWVKNYLEDYDFEEDFDYIGVDINVEGNNVKTYIISTDMAKEICMMSNTKVGSRIRKYFINIEKVKCDYHNKQLDLARSNLKVAQSKNRKTYKDGFMSLTKYINDNDLNMKQSEAFEILNRIGAIEYQETTVIRAVLVDETLGRQIDFGVIEFNSRALDGIFNIKRPATLFED